MRIGSIVIDCNKFEEMLTFWEEALHYVPRESAKGGWVVLRDPEDPRPVPLQADGDDPGGGEGAYGRRSGGAQSHRAGHDVVRT